MNCEVAHERIVTSAYGELQDEQAHELERHMASCPDCRKEREQSQALRVVMDANPVIEPSPNLIARSRLRLEEALDALPPQRWYERLEQRLRNNLAGLRAAPVAACVLLLVGTGAGSFGGYRLAVKRAMSTASQAAVTPVSDGASPHATATPQISNVTSISSIVRQPNSDIVEVRFKQLVPERVVGSLNNPAVRQLLMLASENAASPDLRDDSVGLLAAACRAANGCQGLGIRDALMVALRYDKDPEVRKKALEGLQPYVAQDMRVRNAVLEALLYDSDPEIRTDSINILEPVEADTSVRQALYTVANSDNNPQIRNVSRQVLSRVPEIQ